MNEQLKALLKDAVSDADLGGNELPLIDLYVDQIISLISDRTQMGAERYRDRVLTKTMINNYSKEGLIKPIKGKKYAREQVLQMLYIYALKGTLSIGEIKRLLYGIYHAEDGFDGTALGECYDRFLDMKENNRAGCIETLDALMQKNGLDPENERDYFLTILGAVSLSAYFKSAAEAMLEARYPDPDVDEKEKKEAEAEEKHRKEAEEKASREAKKTADRERAEKQKAAKIEKKKNSQKKPDGEPDTEPAKEE